MGQLERVNGQLATFRTGRDGGEQRTSIDQWISEYLLPSGMVNQFTFGGHVYPFGGPNLTYGANKAREFTGDLPGHAAAVKACPPAFAAEMVRALVLSRRRGSRSACGRGQKRRGGCSAPRTCGCWSSRGRTARPVT